MSESTAVRGCRLFAVRRGNFITSSDVSHRTNSMSFRSLILPSACLSFLDCNFYYSYPDSGHYQESGNTDVLLKAKVTWRPSRQLESRVKENYEEEIGSTKNAVQHFAAIVRFERTYCHFYLNHRGEGVFEKLF